MNRGSQWWRVRRCGAPLALVAFAVGCGNTDAPRAAAGGGDDPPLAAPPTNAVTPTAAAPAPKTSSPRVLRIAMGEWAVVPERRAVRPGRTTLVISNRGKVAHGFELKAESGRDRGGDDDLEIESRVLDPGQTVRVTVDLPAGEYEFECYVADHEERGMTGMLDVRPDAPAPARPRPRPSAGGTTVGIDGFAFLPRSITVSVGQTVTWTNRDAAPHTVTQANGQFAAKELGQRARYARRFTRAGTYPYICALHPGMRGAVKVRFGP